MTLKRFIISLCIVLLSACGEPAPEPAPTPAQPEEPAPTEPAPTDPDDPAPPDLPDPTEEPLEDAELASITFESSDDYEAAGTASIVREDGELRLELNDDFEADPRGPDLYLRLVPDKDSLDNFIEIAPLQSFSGAQSYELDLDNVDDYEAIYIWCKRFGGLFGSGVLEKN